MKLLKSSVLLTVLSVAAATVIANNLYAGDPCLRERKRLALLHLEQNREANQLIQAAFDADYQIRKSYSAKIIDWTDGNLSFSELVAAMSKKVRKLKTTGLSYDFQVDKEEEFAILEICNTKNQCVSLDFSDEKTGAEQINEQNDGSLIKTWQDYLIEHASEDCQIQVADEGKKVVDGF